VARQVLGCADLNKPVAVDWRTAVAILRHVYDAGRQRGAHEAAAGCPS